LNKNSDISGNKYNSEYNAVGIGGVGGIDTAGHEAGFAEDGTFYFCTKVDDTNTAALIRDTVPGTALTNVVSIATLGSAGYKNQWKTDHQREDDPLGADAYDLCAPLELEVKELTIVNNTGMFKGVSAHLEVTPAGETTLVFALSGTGYHYLYRGTYEEAVENGDNRENWIAGYLNDAGKWEFRVSVSGDDNEMIPLVAISQPYLEKYEAGQNPLERAFYPRQADLNIDDLVVTFDDYHRYTGLSITNNVEDFDVEDAMITTIGGPNSNGYAATLQLILGSDAFDQAYFGSAEEAAAADTTIAVNAEDHSVEIKLMWIVTAGDPSSIVSYLGEDVVISFHSAEDGKWHEMIFNANEADATLVISAEEPSDDVNVNLPEGYPLEEGTDYSVDGNVITVTHETPCKVGYYDEEQGRYVEIEAQPVEGEENTYTFTAPEGVTDVVIVVKGDATLDGSVNLGDAARIKAFYRHKTDLDALEMFAADINSDGSVNLGDASKITAVFRKKTTVDW
ncbi:MAG: dockerin type I repeat-containing protein, partial [Firmicutes bacterium]|nr:dockerin type I repeat-containing protein [Bacillota bacterium]